MVTKLETIAIEQRNIHLSRNTYDNVGNGYSAEHKNAKSDGDQKGKDEIGSSDDINARVSNLVKNPYIKEKGYSSGHKNAISDGDPKGKGQNNEDIGSSDDIKERKFGITKNEFNEKNQYPNFE